MLSFSERLRMIQADRDTSIFLLLRPLMSEMPAPMHYHDDPFLPFSKAIIGETRDLVCGYIFDFPAYMVHGAAGGVALERSIGYAGADTLRILHGTFVGRDYANVVYAGAFGADAATIADKHDYGAFVTAGNREAFVVAHGDETEARHYPLYWADQEILTLPGGERATVAGVDVLYSGYMNDFAKCCRDSLAALRDS